MNTSTRMKQFENSATKNKKNNQSSKKVSYKEICEKMPTEMDQEKGYIKSPQKGQGSKTKLSWNRKYIGGEIKRTTKLK